jgi:N-acetylneuraminic acid mutarotase
MLRAILLVCLLISLGCSRNAITWRALPPLPQARGLAGGFAGVSDGALIFAGGSNFPDAPPWREGKKVWYDAVYALDRPDGKWSRVGSLPEPHGYGASVTYGDAILCIGGGDARHNVADVLCLKWDGSHLTTTRLSPLPATLANACAAVVGDDLFVAGGQRSPDATEASRDVYRLNLRAPGASWESVAPLPGPGRILAAAANCSGAFWVIGGAALSPGPDGKPVRRYLADAYRFDPAKGWKRVADLPVALAASPSPVPCDGDRLYLLGGDDGSAVGISPPERHPGFNRHVFRYDARRDAWSNAGQLPVAQVTTSAVRWGAEWVVCSGEVRPGVRSPDVWAYRFRR